MAEALNDPVGRAKDSLEEASLHIMPRPEDSFDPDPGWAGPPPRPLLPVDRTLPAVHPFSRLQASTNLNCPPRNWLQSRVSAGADCLTGFGATPHYTGFSSLRMAHHFVEFLHEVDVVADAENIKKLLKMPYSNAPVSLIVHRVGHSILIDEFDIHGFLLRSSEAEWKWMKKFFYDTVLASLGEKTQGLVRRNIRHEAIQERNLVSKFLYRSLEAGGESVSPGLKAIVYDQNSVRVVPPCEAEPESSVTVAQPAPGPTSLQLLPEPPLLDQGKLPDPQSSSHKFARNLLWNFEDIRMLIGSDLPIFGDAEHPSVSLRLHSGKKPINILTGLDYWLDNLMCHIPEVLMCFHLDGIVQRYELLKTEDLPNLQDCQFSPRVVRDVAKNILSFIQSNAAHEGHTYWLFKGKNDDFVKLYDLTSICDEAEKQNPNKDAAEESKFRSPFRTAVATLLYKVARNMLSGVDQDAQEHGRTVRQLLESCLKLLDGDKHPELVTSAHFMLSEIYLPDATDPFSPKFGDTEEIKCPKSSSATNNVSMIDIKTLKSPNFPMPQGEYYEPPPLPQETKERCRASLKHVVEGLEFLNQLSKRQHEVEDQLRKDQEMKERDNPKTCHPNEAIPMPFEDAKSKRQRAQSESSVQTMSATQISAGKSGGLWNDHLKSVLLKKAFLIYITMSELHFRTEHFGSSLRCFKRALNCYKVVALKHREVSGDTKKSFLISFAFGLAADCYMAMVRHWKNMANYQEEYNQSQNFDLSIAQEIENFVEESLRDWKIQIPRDMEDAIQKAIACLEHGLKIVDKEKVTASPELKLDFESMISRLANAQNEIGVFYMHQANQLSGTIVEGEENSDAASSVRFIIDRSIVNLGSAQKNFEAVKDSLNCALIHCNIGRAFKVKAYLFEASGESSGDAGVLDIYDKALKHYEQSIGLVGQRKKNPDFWDSIIWEYSGTLYHIGNQLQTGSPKATLSRDEAEKKVLECYKKALNHCDLVTEGPRLSLYQYRVLKIHVGLAQLYTSSSAAMAMDSRHNSRFAHLVEQAETHYECAAQLASTLDKSAEHLRILAELFCLYFVAFERLQKSKDLAAFIGKALAHLGAIFDVLAVAEKPLPDENEEDGKELDFLLSFLVKKLQEFFLFVNQYLKTKKKKHVEAQLVAKDIYSKVLRLSQKPPQDSIDSTQTKLEVLEVLGVIRQKKDILKSGMA